MPMPAQPVMRALASECITCARAIFALLLRPINGANGSCRDSRTERDVHILQDFESPSRIDKILIRATAPSWARVPCRKLVHRPVLSAPCSDRQTLNRQ